MKSNSYSNILKLFCRLDESYRPMLNESQESKSISQAKNLVMQRLGYTEEQADEFVRIKIRNDITALKTKEGGKFILGATRMFLDQELMDATSINQLNKTLKLVSSDAHINEYDRNLNGMHYQELIDRFSGAIKQMGSEDRAKLETMYFEPNNNYNIVRIDSFEQSQKYGGYTSWCVTTNESMYDHYTCNGIRQFYFCLQNGYENIQATEGENCPLDEYGLSMIAVNVDEEGDLFSCTCRWNHDNGGNDTIMNTEEISHLIGKNFYTVFLPNNKWQNILEAAKIKLENGLPLNEVFDKCTEFVDGIAIVELFSKFNYITEQRELLSEEWFDDCQPFSEGYGTVFLNRQYNLIGSYGNYLFDEWFDFCGTLKNGYVNVKVGKEWNFINTNGEYLTDQWFERCKSFNEGFAAVQLNKQWNLIDTNGEYITDQWFYQIYDFKNGSSVVKNSKHKYNLLTEYGELLLTRWVDECYSFKSGHLVIINYKCNIIDAYGDYCYKQWFEMKNPDFFSPNFYAIKMNNKYNVVYINDSDKTCSDFLLKQWVDEIISIYKGYVKFIFKGKKYELNLYSKKLYLDYDDENDIEI